MLDLTRFPGSTNPRPHLAFTERDHFYVQDTETGDPAHRAMGTNEVKKCTVEEINILYWADKSSKAGQKSIVPA